MRKLIMAVAVVLGLVVVGVGAALALFDANSFREPIRSQLEKQLGRSVTVGGVGLKIFPLSIRLDNVGIAESPQFGADQKFAAVKELAVRLSLSALLRKQVNVESIRIVQPEIELIRNEQGKWNIATLGPASGATSSSGSSDVRIKDLQIQDARVAVTDRMNRKPRTVYPHIDASLRDYAPGKRFTTAAEVRFDEAGSQRLTVHAAGVPSDLDGDIALKSVTLPALLAFTGSNSSGVPAAALNGTAKFQTRSGKLNGNGTLDISEKRLKTPAHVEFDLAGDSDAGFWSVPSARLKVGALTATAKGEAHIKEDPGTIAAELQTSNASLAELLDLASALGVAADLSGTGTLNLTATARGSMKDPAVEVKGSVRDASLKTPALTKPLEIKTAAIAATKDSARFDDVVASLGPIHANGRIGAAGFAHPRLDFDIKIDELDAGAVAGLIAPSTGKASGPDKPLNGAGSLEIGKLTYNQVVMTGVRAKCALDNGIVRLDPVSARLFGGDQTGAIEVDTRGAQSGYAVRAHLTKVDANQLLSSTTSIRQLLFGNLSGDIDVKASPRPNQDIANALNGSVRFQMTDGKLAGVHLLNEAASIAKVLGFAKAPEPVTNILKLSGTVRIDNGIANTDDLALALDGGSVAAAGSIGLADQQLKLRLTTVLGKELMQRTGSPQIAGLMSTVLANAKGELVVPSLVSGTLAKPRFMPDPERIAKMKLEGLLPSSNDPRSAATKIQGILGQVLGGKQQNQPPQQADSATPAGAQPAKKAKGIFDIIDSVRKKAEQK